LSGILEQYLQKNQRKLDKIDPPPIILRWMDSPGMRKSLSLIETHVEYLQSRTGGTKKLQEWLLADDTKFNTFTAERYIVSYLRRKNANIVDNLSKVGVDAHLNIDGERVGIEITTLNKFWENWVWTERLMQILDDHRFLRDKSLVINYSRSRIAMKNSKAVYEYVHEAAAAIMEQDHRALDGLGISVSVPDIPPGNIAWNISDKTDDFPWLDYITNGVHGALRARKKPKQLKACQRNLVFVGLNHVSPVNWAFPRLFGELESSNTRYDLQIAGITDFWNSSMRGLTNVIGICYFFYSLDSEEPFYPLHIFWRSNSDRIAINL
jgi:hypothetical protein